MRFVKPGAERDGETVKLPAFGNFIGAGWDGEGVKLAALERFAEPGAGRDVEIGLAAFKKLSSAAAGEGPEGGSPGAGLQGRGLQPQKAHAADFESEDFAPTTS